MSQVHRWSRTRLLINVAASLLMMLVMLAMMAGMLWFMWWLLWDDFVADWQRLSREMSLAYAEFAALPAVEQLSRIGIFSAFSLCLAAMWWHVRGFVRDGKPVLLRLSLYVAGGIGATILGISLLVLQIPWLEFAGNVLSMCGVLFTVSSFFVLFILLERRLRSRRGKKDAEARSAISERC